MATGNPIWKERNRGTIQFTPVSSVTTIKGDEQMDERKIAAVAGEGERDRERDRVIYTTKQITSMN